MVNDIIDPLRSASKSALGQFTQLAGLNSIPSSTVRSALKNMTPDDLDALAAEYGTDQVIHLLRKSLGGQHAV
jgi:hypothetical protein